MSQCFLHGIIFAGLMLILFLIIQKLIQKLAKFIYTVRYTIKGLRCIHRDLQYYLGYRRTEGDILRNLGSDIYKFDKIDELEKKVKKRGK